MQIAHRWTVEPSGGYRCEEDGWTLFVGSTRNDDYFVEVGHWDSASVEEDDQTIANGESPLWRFELTCSGRIRSLDVALNLADVIFQAIRNLPGIDETQ